MYFAKHSGWLRMLYESNQLGFIKLSMGYKMLFFVDSINFINIFSLKIQNIHILPIILLNTIWE